MSGHWVYHLRSPLFVGVHLDLVLVLDTAHDLIKKVAFSLGVIYNFHYVIGSNSLLIFCIVLEAVSSAHFERGLFVKFFGQVLLFYYIFLMLLVFKPCDAYFLFLHIHRDFVCLLVKVVLTIKLRHKGRKYLLDSGG
jgi:hypothetical protein